MTNFLICLFSAIFVMIPYSIAFDVIENERKFDNLNKFEELILIIICFIILIAPVVFWTVQYLIEHNFNVEFSDLFVQILLYIIGNIFMFGFIYVLYDKVLKYPTRFVRGVLYEIFYSLKGFIFMQNHDKVTKTAKEDWVNFLIENKVSEETFAKITPFASHNDFINWAQQQGGDIEVLGVKIMKKQWEK